MKEVTIEVATAADIDELVGSVSGLFHDDAGQHDPCMDLTWPAREGPAAYGDVVDDPSALLLLARAGDRVVGHLVGKLREPNSMRPCRLAILESMRVAPDARGQGVGSRLVERFFQWARECKAVQASVSAYAANERARRFYARHGFELHEVTMRTALDA
jgi:GNAT superfamily N-acetyltransferase